jgi:hypothetical protein
MSHSSHWHAHEVGGFGALGLGIFKGLSNRANDRAGERLLSNINAEGQWVTSFPIGKENQISELMRKKNELEVRAEDLRNINAQVGLLETTFVRIADRLSVMEQIWNMVCSSLSVSCAIVYSLLF